MEALRGHDPFEFGWPSLIISLWFLSGLTFSFLGVIGMYLSKIFTETKDRPYTIIQRSYDRLGEEYLGKDRTEEHRTDADRERREA